MKFFNVRFDEIFFGIYIYVFTNKQAIEWTKNGKNCGMTNVLI